MSSRLFIGNLSYDATEDDIREAFAENGYELKSVSVPIDKQTNNPRGFGFVELESAEDAKAAMGVMDGTVIVGRAIRVGEAHERERRPSSQPERQERKGGGRPRRDSREERDRRW